MSDKERIDYLEKNIVHLVELIQDLTHKVDKLDKEANYTLKGLDERIDVIERNHRFMSYKLPDELSRYYGHKLLPGLNPDDLKEDNIKHERSKYEDVIDDDLPDIKD